MFNTLMAAIFLLGLFYSGIAQVAGYMYFTLGRQRGVCSFTHQCHSLAKLAQPDKMTTSPENYQATAISFSPCVYIPMSCDIPVHMFPTIVTYVPSDLYAGLYTSCVHVTCSLQYFIGFWNLFTRQVSGLYKQRPRLVRRTKPSSLSCTTDTLKPSLRMQLCEEDPRCEVVRSCIVSLLQLQQSGKKYHKFQSQHDSPRFTLGCSISQPTRLLNFSTNQYF